MPPSQPLAILFLLRAILRFLPVSVHAWKHFTVNHFLLVLRTKFTGNFLLQSAILDISPTPTTIARLNTARYSYSYRLNERKHHSRDCFVGDAVVASFSAKEQVKDSYFHWDYISNNLMILVSFKSFKLIYVYNTVASRKIPSQQIKIVQWAMENNLYAKF